MELGPIFRALVRHRVRLVLVVLEVALTLAIVANCASLVLDARRQMAKTSGFDDANLLAVSVEPFSSELTDKARLNAAIDADLRRLGATSGVRSATHTYFTPWIGGGSSTEVHVPGSETKYRTQYYPVSPQILDTLGIELTSGRAPDQATYDRNGDGSQVNDYDGLVSEALAKLVFGDVSPLGRVVETTGGSKVRVVGTFASFYNPYGWPIGDYAIFLPVRSGGFPGGWQFLVRSVPGEAPKLAGEIERTLLAADGDRNVRVTPIPEIHRRYDMSNSVLIWALEGVMLFLIFVTALGIAGLTSFSVAERTRQIGTRRALGATRGAILRYFLAENWLVTSLGVALGCALAVALNVAVVHVAAGARLSPLVLAAGVVALWALGAAATLGPALRASRVAPAIATRNV